MNDVTARIHSLHEMAKHGSGTSYIGSAEALALLDYATKQGERFDSVEAFKILGDDGGMQLDLSYSLLGLEGEDEISTEKCNQIVSERIASALRSSDTYLFKVWI